MTPGDAVLLAAVVLGCAAAAVSGPLTQRWLDRRERQR